MTDADAVDLVQQKFEQHLGPLRPLPGALFAAGSAAGADVREKERVSFRAARGLALDYQAVPAVGTLVGVTFQSARRAPQRTPAPRLRSSPSARVTAPTPDASPAASPSSRTSPLLGSSQASLPAAGGAGSPQQAQQQPQGQPANATLWALVQPNERAGVHTTVCARDSVWQALAGGLSSGFESWHQCGFLDLSKRVGVDYSLSCHASGGLSGELMLQATAPKLPLLPQPTVQQAVAGTLSGGRTEAEHTSSLKLPLLGGAALARLQMRRPAARPEGTSVTFELQGRGKQSRGLAGGAKVQAGLSDAFLGTNDDGSSGGSSGSSSKCGASSVANGGSSSSDDDDESSSRTHNDPLQKQGKRGLPGLRLHAVPAAVRSWEDVSGHWRQAWGGGLSSTLSYQGCERRWSLQLGSKLGSRLTAGGTLACKGPGDAAAAINGRAGEGSAGFLASRLAPVRRAQRCVGAYLGSSQLCSAGLKMTYRLQRPVRQQVRLEVGVGQDGGLSHALRYQLGGAARSDWQQQRAWADVSLRGGARERGLLLQVDAFAPL